MINLINYFIFKLKKFIYGRYNIKYYPRDIKLLVKDYLKKNSRFNYPINKIKKKINTIKKNKDPELEEKFFRFEELNSIENKKKVIKKILSAYRYFNKLNKNKNDKFVFVQEGYNISYRIINLIEFSNKYNFHELKNYIQLESYLLLQRLEYFNNGFNNHILKNAQALIYSGIYLNDFKLEKIGLLILKSSFRSLILKNGLLRESSSSYQILISKLLLELSEFMIINKRKKKNNIIISILKKMICASNFFKIDNNLIIFGDTTPDYDNRILQDKVFNHKKYFPKTYKNLKNIRKKINPVKLGEFYKMQNKNFLIFYKFRKNSILKHLNHQHEDNFHFNLYFNHIPLLVDLNRASYASLEGTYSNSHNSILLEYKNKSKKRLQSYPYNYPINKNFRIIKKSKKHLNLKSYFTDSNKLNYMWSRGILLKHNQFKLIDFLKTNKLCKKNFYLHIHPDFKLFKKKNNVYTFKNSKKKYQFNLICNPSNGTKIKQQINYYSDTYGITKKTLSLIFQNNIDIYMQNEISLTIKKI